LVTKRHPWSAASARFTPGVNLRIATPIVGGPELAAHPGRNIGEIRMGQGAWA